MKCAVNGCSETIFSLNNYCDRHVPESFLIDEAVKKLLSKGRVPVLNKPETVNLGMSIKYPKYYKPIPKGVTELDIYAVCQMFNVTDAAITHSLKKLMLPGVRTGGKSMRDDIKEARDTLNRWLELNPE